MSLILELDPVTERKLENAAVKSGISSQAFALDVLKDRLVREDSKSIKRVPAAELLAEISSGPTEDEWARYKLLISKRRQDRLRKTELTELIAFSDRLERLSARRLELVVELARRNRTTLEAEMKRLGLAPRHV